MERIVVFVSATLFVIWLIADILYWGMPAGETFRNGMLPHRRIFDLIGLALLICAGAGCLIWAIRAIFIRLRGRT
jgi:hypothetical protein